MSDIVRKLDQVEGEVEGWWWHLSTNTRWFAASISAALVLGVAGGLLG